jgi:hypothetical protein
VLARCVPPVCGWYYILTCLTVFCCQAVNTSASPNYAPLSVGTIFGPDLFAQTYDDVVPDIVLAGGSVVFSVMKAFGNAPVGTFEPSDIDVFVRQSAFSALHQRLLTENVWGLVKKDFNAGARNLLDAQMLGFDDESHLPYLHDYNGLGLTIAAVAYYAPTQYLAAHHSLHTVTAECCKLQIIILHDDILNPLEHIARFDICCCKSFFDGKNLKVMGMSLCYSPLSASHGTSTLSNNHSMWMTAIYMLYDEHCIAKTVKKNWMYIPLAAMTVPTPKPIHMFDFYYQALRKVRRLCGNPTGFLQHLGKTLAALQ